MNPIFHGPPEPNPAWSRCCSGWSRWVRPGSARSLEPEQFFFSYLYGYLFWLGLSLGCFMVAMIHQLTGGRWGYPTRRFLEAGYLVLPLMLVLLIPVLLGLHELYPWARPAEVAAEKALRERHVYLNAWAYTARQVFFLLVWIWMAWCLRKWSLQQDTTADAAPTRKARALSGPGLVIYSLLGTFAYVDWIMSLENDWYSTMFAVIVLIGQILTAFAFVIVLLTLFRHEPPIAQALTRTHYHHLGNLLLTFVLFWTYVSFGQLLIIYSGDLPQELEWYLHRIAGSWKWVIAVIGLFHFFLPFFLLLFRTVKKNIGSLTTLAALLFVAHLVDTYWLVMPTLTREAWPSVGWISPRRSGLAASGWPISCRGSKQRALLPPHDPGLQFAFAYGHNNPSANPQGPPGNTQPGYEQRDAPWPAGSSALSSSSSRRASAFTSSWAGCRPALEEPPSDDRWAGSHILPSQRPAPPGANPPPLKPLRFATPWAGTAPPPPFPRLQIAPALDLETFRTREERP